MKTDVLFVHHQLAFAVSIKQALERTGNYDVHPFTSVEAALEYLRGHAQDVALVDFMMPVYSGEEIVERLRQVQSQVTVVATPTQTEEEFARLGLQGMLQATFTAREFIPVIERALEGRRTGELPTAAQKAGLLDRVQPDSSIGKGAPERRPPTSVIGYRSLESILDQGAAASEPPPATSEDAPTLVQGLPAARPPDDLGFMDDVTPPAPASPEAVEEPEERTNTDRLADAGEQEFIDEAEPEAADDESEAVAGINTDRLTDMDKFKSEEFPEFPDEPAAVDAEALRGVTQPLPEGAFDFDEDASAEPPPKSVSAGEDVPWSEGGYGTRPLPDMEFDDEAEALDHAAEDAGLETLSSKLRERDLFGTRPLEPGDDEAEIYDHAAEDAGLETLSSKLRERDLFGTRPLEPGDDEYDLFGSGGDVDVLATFDADDVAEDADQQDTPDQPVDYMAELNLTPSAPAEVPSAPLPPPPTEEEVVAGLVALFDSEAEDAPPTYEEFSLDDLLDAPDDTGGDFADVLGEIAPGEAAERERNQFDDLVASMSTQEQRPPLPARQQQYVDVSLTDDVLSLTEQIEQARTGGESGSDAGDAPYDLGPVDLSAVLFEDDEEMGGDTPSTPGLPPLPDESPALASSEELAALFAAMPPGDESEQPEPDFDAMFTEQPAESEADFEALYTEQPAQPDLDFESLFADQSAPAEADFEATFIEPASEPEAEDFEALFTEQPVVTEADFDAMFMEQPADSEADFEAMFDAEQPAEAEAAAEEPFSAEEPELQPDFDSMFGEPAAAEVAPFPPDLDIFGGDWAAGDLVEVDQNATFEDTGTVSDLMTGVGEVTGGRSGMLTRLDSDLPPPTPEKPARTSAETTAAPLPPIDDSVTALLAEIELQLMAAPPPAGGISQELDDDSGDTPARRILATTSEAELADSSFSVDSLLDNIEAQMPPNQAKVQPLPSWLRAEPAPLVPLIVPAIAPEDGTLDYSPEMADETLEHAAPAIVDEEPPFDWESATFDDTTVMGEAARLEQFKATGDEETSWLEFIGPEQDSEVDATLVAGVAVGAAGAAAVLDAADEDAEAEPDADAAVQAEHIDDPYIAQLAVSLTDVSLELTADAVLLTRERDIAAFAGRMDRAELLELRQVIDDDWEATSEDARIRFLRLPDSGKDVMLYSRRTVEDLTLSLVFDGEMPLRDIRQQGKRLTDALAAVPEAPVELVLPIPLEDEVSADDAPTIPRSPHAYVWLLRDPDATLARPVAQAILNGINQQMHEHGWRVRELRASEDHIYLLADSPDEQPPYVAVRELMRRSAQIAHVQNPALDAKSLWADAYLVVTPGRTLEDDEIQQFIQFERML